MTASPTLVIDGRTVLSATGFSKLHRMVTERVDLALADEATQLLLRSKGISLADARSFLIERTRTQLMREAGFA